MARKKKTKKQKKTVDEKISEALGVSTPSKTKATTPAPAVAEPVEGEVVDTAIVVHEDQPLTLGYPIPGENPDIKDDYESTRKHLESVREQAEDALDKMKEVAEQSEQARAYEVVAQLVKVNAELADQKIKLHKDMKALRDQDNKAGQRAAHIGDVNNAIVVGSTADLLKLKKAGKLPKVDDSK